MLPPHIPLFDILGAVNTSLLRTSATTAFDGNTWKFDSSDQINAYNGEQISPSVKGYSQKQTNEIKVTPVDKYSSGEIPLPTALYPVSMSSSVPLYYLPDDQIFISKQGLPDSYSFQSVRYDFNKATLDGAKVDPVPEYLQLASSTTARTRQLAQDITQNIASPYEQAKAIEKYLKDNYAYDFDYQPAPQGADPNDWFLFNEKKGVCANFNSAFVTLARAAGIPSRLVSGYAIKPESTEQTVYADQAHAWAEVKFKDLGWITFDATGSAPKPLATHTEITSVSPVVRKGHSFTVQGTVQAQSVTVEGVLVEIYINPKKSHEGGLLIGRGIVTQGAFNIEVNIPETENVGNYQMLAHSLNSARFQESWSDPPIKVTSGTQINLSISPRVKLLEPVRIMGKLTEESAKPIAGQKIDLALNGKTVSRLTSGQDGQFQLEQSYDHAGDYTLEAAFSGTEYYLQSHQAAKFQVLIPTIINLRVPQAANSKESVLIVGSLLEEKTRLPVPDQRVEILADGQVLSNKVTTDKNGQFSVEHTFDKAGIYQMEAKFSSASYYWESQTGAVVQILSATGGVFWIYPIILAAVVAGAGGGFFLYRWRKKRLPTTPAIVQEAARPEEIPPEAEGKRGDGVNLNIEFPGIEPPLPDVWGMGEELEIACHLTNADKVPMVAKPLQLISGNPIANINTDASGTARLALTFEEKGQQKLVARYSGEPGIESVATSRTIRIIDYREEIVDLYKALQDWFREIGITLSKDATHRETGQIVIQSRKGVPEAALKQALNCFEEADYSLHPVNRKNYKIMYLAQKEMRENEPRPSQTRST